MDIGISIVQNYQDISPVDKILTTEEFTKHITTHNIGVKNNARAFIASHYNGRKRSNNNIIKCTLIVLDVDNYSGNIIDLESNVKQDLGNYHVIAYSSASHTNESPRIRIILPLTNDILKEDYKDIVTIFIGKLSQKLRDALDITSSTTPGKLWFLPTKPTKDSDTWTLILDGERLDPYAFSTKIFPSLLTPSSPNAAGHKDPLFMAIHSLISDKSEKEIIAILKSYPADHTTNIEWVKVGWALHHQYKGEIRGLQLWDSWSKKDLRQQPNNQPMYPGKSELRKRWKGFTLEKENPYKIETLVGEITKKININEKQKFINSYKPLPNECWEDTYGKSSLPLFTHNNFQIFLDYYNIKLKFDLIKKRVNIIFNDQKESRLNSAFTEIKLLCTLNKLPVNLVHETIYKFAWSNIYNSWEEWVISKPWDRLDRFEAICQTLIVDKEYEERKRIYLHKWLLQMIHVTCLNDSKFGKDAGMVLTLQGDQGIGKTRWIKSLVPGEMANYVHSALGLDLKKDMDIKLCTEHIFIELGELGSTFRKSDMDVLKGFLTNTQDKVPIKYIADHEEYRRRTVFCGTVNDTDFLQDQTGNRRFLVLPLLKCHPLNTDDPTKPNYLDIQQLYAQLLEYAKEHPDYHLTPEETALQTQLNKKFQKTPIITEDFMDKFNMDLHTIENKNASPKVLQNLQYTKMNKYKIFSTLGYNIQARTKYSKDLDKILEDFKYDTSPRGWWLPPYRDDPMFNCDPITDIF